MCCQAASWVFRSDKAPRPADRPHCPHYHAHVLGFVRQSVPTGVFPFQGSVNLTADTDVIIARHQYDVTSRQGKPPW